jgi:hypothetical protein
MKQETEKKLNEIIPKLKTWETVNIICDDYASKNKESFIGVIVEGDNCVKSKNMYSHLI